MTSVTLWLILLLSASTMVLAWGWRRHLRLARAGDDAPAIERLVACVLRQAVDLGADEIWLGRPDPDSKRSMTRGPPGNVEAPSSDVSDVRRRGDLETLEILLPPDEDLAPGELWLRTAAAWIEQPGLPRHLEGDFYDALCDALRLHPEDLAADRRSWYRLGEDWLKLHLAIDAQGRRIIRICAVGPRVVAGGRALS